VISLRTELATAVAFGAQPQSSEQQKLRLSASPLHETQMAARRIVVRNGKVLLH